MFKKIALTALAACLFSVNSYAADKVIRLATTTSTDNSGLLAHVLPPFEKQTGYTVHVIAVGTGKALRMGEDGDADVLLVHARSREEKFIKEGHGVNRRDVMYNDFLIAGAKADPAKVKGKKTVSEVMKAIHAQGDNTAFVSRGDNSGTHFKEKGLWEAAGVKPTGKWYREAGQGMGAVLRIADQMNAYVLVDRGTWLASKAKLELTELFSGDTKLFNPYGIIAVNPEKYNNINYTGAMALVTWFTSVEGQKLISEFKINGEQLFIPVAARTK